MGVEVIVLARAFRRAAIGGKREKKSIIVETR